MKRLTVIVFLFTICISTTWAGGFELYEFGARASALSGAVTARAWDASTIFYNPAGLAFLSGTRFYGGVTFITATNIYQGPEPILGGEKHETLDAIHHPIGIYFSHQFTDDLFAGIGVTNPFGLGLEWDKEDFPGRGVAFNTDLKSFYISPVVAYKLTDNLSISGGLDLVLGTVTLERSVYPFADETSPGIEVARTKIEGTSNLAVGFTASAMYQTEELGLGFLYRHSVDNKLEDGDVTWEYLDTPFQDFAAASLNFTKVSTELSFPNFFAVGVYYRFLENMGIEVDYMWYNWSVFDELLFTFEDDAGNTAEQSLPENYEDSMQFRVGVHYDFTPEFQLRLGYIYDETPQPVSSMSPLLPDNDRNDFSIGFGYTMDNMQFDIGYMIVDFGERSTVVDGVGQNDSGFDGTYASVAHLLFISYGITLD
jgi:long-chain fatty acid transport protein